MPTPSPAYRPSTVHLRLGETLYDPVQPATFPQYRLRLRHQAAAARVGLEHLTEAEWVEHLGRFTPLPGSLPEPIALRYHGHQFQHYNPDLGDGRGFLFAQLQERDSERILDLGTKGSGTTPWSRGGDGRLTLQGAVREVLAAELLEARGVPTCQILSVIETGEHLYRHDEDSPARGAVMVRLSHSHIRFGTFQRLAYLREFDTLRQLIDHVVEHYHPQVADAPDRPAALLGAALEASCTTLGGWMAAGFVHGVLNTDNMNITGESFDYGPWRFAVDLDPQFTAAYFDHGKLYAYGRQPNAVRWNLTQLARALAPVGNASTLETVLERFGELSTEALTTAWMRRLGVRPSSPLRDRSFVQRLTRLLTETRLPVDRFVFDWYGGSSAVHRALASPLGALYRRRWFAPIRAALEAREPVAGADAWVDAAPGPTSLPIDEVRNIWQHIAREDHWQPFLDKVAAIRRRRVEVRVSEPRIRTGTGRNSRSTSRTSAS